MKSIIAEAAKTYKYSRGSVSSFLNNVQAMVKKRFGNLKRGNLGFKGYFQFFKQKNKKSLKYLFLILSGTIIGLLNGFFGGGGGMVCVPILEKVLNLDSKHAHATAIAVILPISLISASIYVYNGYLQSQPLLIVGAGVVVGGVLGAYALKVLPPKAIKIIFAIIMFAGGIKLII